MKKILALTLTIILTAMLAFPAFAEEVDTATVDTTVETEAEANTVVDTDNVINQSAETETVTLTDIENEKYAQQFINYVFSGAEGSQELMDKIIAMGEQFAEQKEAGYTFKERIEQLVTPDNMITSISALFLVICGIAVFVFKNWQKRSSLALHKDISILKDKYDDERKENEKLREDVTMQTKEIEELKSLIVGLCERSDISKTDMDHVSHTATAVARMVKDVFLNSKTIDASGKALLVHNYMDAIGAEETSNAEATEVATNNE